MLSILPIEMPVVASVVASVPSEERQGGCLRCVSCEREQAYRRPVLRSDAARRPFDLVRCAACGLVQQYPRYTAERISALYDEEYYVFAEDEACRWARALQQYAIHILRWETGAYRRLLDVGSALGHCSALAARRGWRVVGLDVSPEAVSRSAVQFGLDVRAGRLEQHRQTLPPFDVVFLGDVLEHVPEPVAFMRGVHQVLSPGGVVCIDTPNWGGRWRRWGRGRWLGLNRFHINLFDADSLARLLASCGFDEIEMGSYTNYRYESWANRPELQPFIQRLPRQLAWRINRFLERRAGRKPWAMLRESPPATLEATLGLLDDLTTRRKSLDVPRLAGDNLIASAKRQST